MSNNVTVHLPRKLPKGITEDRATELTRWVYKVWDMHWKEFAPTSNSRSQFQSYVLRDHKILTTDLLKTIENSIRAYAKHLRDLKNKNQKLIGIKTLSVWYNQECYNDQFIDDENRRSAATVLAKCCDPSCDNDVHGPMFKHCTDHIPNTKLDTLRAGYQQMLDDGVVKKGQNLRQQYESIVASKITNVTKSMPPAPQQMSRDEQLEKLELPDEL